MNSVLGVCVASATSMAEQGEFVWGGSEVIWIYSATVHIINAGLRWREVLPCCFMCFLSKQVQAWSSSPEAYPLGEKLARSIPLARASLCLSYTPTTL